MVCTKRKIGLRQILWIGILASTLVVAAIFLGPMIMLDDFAPIEPVLEIEVLSELGEYGRPIWFSQDLILVTRHNESDVSFESRIVALNYTTRTQEVVQLPPDPGCSKLSSVNEPMRLPDGRLGYLYRCGNLLSDDKFLMAYDLETHEASRILSYPFPSYASTLHEMWNPDMTQWILVQGGLNSQLYQFQRIGYQRRLIDVGFPVVRTPSWSPDGGSIAFTASNRERSVMRYDIPVQIYIADINTVDVRLASKHVFKTITTLSWSPDSRWLLFHGTMLKSLNTSTEGLWLIDVGTSETFLVTNQDILNPAWSPDGLYIVAIKPTVKNSILGEVVVFPLELGLLVDDRDNK